MTPPPDEPVIRVATRHDLAALVTAFGQRMLFTDRIGRTRQGAGELLVAWVGQVPVGDVYLWCEVLEEPELRAHFPGVPLLNHLEVADGWRGRGVGTALVRAVERAATRRGHRRLLLGVDPANARAKGLYARLGYADWGGGSIVSRWTEPDGAGGIRQASMTVDIMVTTLDPDREAGGGVERGSEVEDQGRRPDRLGDDGISGSRRDHADARRGDGGVRRHRP